MPSELGDGDDDKEAADQYLTTGSNFLKKLMDLFIFLNFF